MIIKALKLLPLAALLTACPYSASKQANLTEITPGKISIIYKCNVNTFDSKDITVNNQDLYFTWLESKTQSSGNKSFSILVSDNQFFKNSSAAILVIDSDRHQIDQIRDKNDNALEYNLTEKYVTKDKGVRETHISFGELILQYAVTALQPFKETNTQNKDVTFIYNSASYKINSQDIVASVEGYGPLPRTISKTNSTDSSTCEFQAFINKK